MCIICDNEPLEGLENLDCAGCETITAIPVIEGLKYLDCSRCPLLQSIPDIKSLAQLTMRQNPQITINSIDCRT